MGLAFKPNIDDLRESPANEIVRKILNDDNHGEYFVVEPNIESHMTFKLTNYNDAIKKADIIVILVAHNEFKTLKFPKEKLVIDFCGIS